MRIWLAFVDADRKASLRKSGAAEHVAPRPDEPEAPTIMAEELLAARCLGGGGVLLLDTLLLPDEVMEDPWSSASIHCGALPCGKGSTGMPRACSCRSATSAPDAEDSDPRAGELESRLEAVIREFSESPPLEAMARQGRRTQ